MQAWVVQRVRAYRHQTAASDRPELPEPTHGQIRISRSRVAEYAAPTCTWPRGTCHPAAPHVTPGHEIVGRWQALGATAHRFTWGPGWNPLARPHRPVLPYCRRGDENLVLTQHSPVRTSTAATPSCVADEQFVYRLPDGVTDEQAAPLLCAGIIGYRSLRAAASPPVEPRHLRIRRQRTPHRADRPALGSSRARPHPRRTQPATGQRPRCGLGRPGHRQRHRNRSMAPSCSHPQVSSSLSRCVHWTLEQHSPSPGSGCPTSRP